MTAVPGHCRWGGCQLCSLKPEPCHSAAELGKEISFSVPSRDGVCQGGHLWVWLGGRWGWWAMWALMASLPTAVGLQGMVPCWGEIHPVPQPILS